MGLLDGLEGLLKGELAHVEAEAVPALLPALLEKTNFGSLQGLVNSLRQGGLGTQIDSWLGSGPNAAITPAILEQALGSEQVQDLAKQFGLPVEAVLKLLAEHLPTAVDQANQNDALQPR